MSRKVYRTMQGKQVDMDALMQRNEMMPAVGNVRMNARGDELGPGGKVVKTREEVMNAYYENNPNAIPSGPKPIPTKPVEQPVTTKKQTKGE
jgi:hypothetical protein